jgi:hypothetical protein
MTCGFRKLSSGTVFATTWIQWRFELEDEGHIFSCKKYSPFGSASYQANRSQTKTIKIAAFTATEQYDNTDCIITERDRILLVGQTTQP